MVYIDTSALVPIFIREESSDRLVAWIESAGERYTISEWTITEFAGAAAAKIRSSHITAMAAKQAMADMERFAERHFSIVIPSREDFRRAAELAGDATFDLRGGDALHVAIAEAVNATGLLCLDARMGKSARALGLNVISP